MTKQKSTWTYQDFLTYLLLYAANADFKVTEEEKNLLLKKCDESEYKNICRIFDSDNDFARIQIIGSFREKYYPDEVSREKLLKDLKDMFLADQKYNSVEKAIFFGLRKILK